MLFQTWPFLFFFAPTLVLYLLVRKTVLRQPVLVLASYLFYAFWDWRFPAFLLAITTVDYFVGRGLASRQKGRGLLLCISLVVNLGCLFAFKYLTFLMGNLQWLLDLLHVDYALPEVTWILPVGLSFFTFKSMSYTCDLYLGRTTVERNFLSYAAYVSFFPQIVAGPISRSGELLPQLKTITPLCTQDFTDGITLFISGLFKKVVMADMLCVYVDMIYDDPTSYGGAALLWASYAFAWQIYFDFSGYSDMARGVARMMGFQTILNFNNPYAAVDVRDFWRRWHISLSTWFRDYVYIPLGGNRCSKIRSWFNLMVTMLVSGLWHGANWSFVVWGGLNGLGSIVSSLFDKSAWYGKIPAIFKQIAVFHFMTLTWVFFRSASFGDAFAVLKGIFTWEEGELLFPAIPFAMVLFIWLYELAWSSPRFHFLCENRFARIATVALALLGILLLGTGASAQFIYQQF